MKNLNEISTSLLRGGATGSNVAAMSDVTTSNLKFVEHMQELYISGDKEALGEVMKTMLRDRSVLKRVVKEAGDATPELALQLGMYLDAIPTGSDLENIPVSLLADLYDHDMYEQIAEHARGLIHVLGDAGSALSTIEQHHYRRLNEEEYEPFDFGSGDSSADSTTEKKGSKFQQDTIMRNMMRRFLHSKGLQLPNDLKKYSKGGNPSPHRERRRRLLEEEDMCPRTCDFDNRECNCRKLRECALALQPFDFAVLFAGSGFIDEDGELRIEEIQLFDADNQLPAKIARIQDLAKNGDSNCDDLLEEFHSSCSPTRQTCSSANEESFHLTVEQICDAVNTPTRLKIEEIANTYDGFLKLGGGPFVDGIVDSDIVQKWYTSQESGEEYCGIDNNGNNLPTTCQVEWLDNSCPFSTTQSTIGNFDKLDTLNIENFPYPNEDRWELYQCAHECAKRSVCKSWYVELNKGGDSWNNLCVLLDFAYPWAKTFTALENSRLLEDEKVCIDNSSCSFTPGGVNSPDCDGVNERCKLGCQQKLKKKLEEVEVEWKESVEVRGEALEVF